MDKKLELYGVVIVERPKIKATKKLDLSGDSGRQIVLSETKLALRTHKNVWSAPLLQVQKTDNGVGLR